MTPDTPATLPVLRVEDLETFRAEDYASPECLALAGELLDAQAIIARLTSERDEAHIAAVQWREVFWAVARELNCLPSTFSDGNAHVLKAAIKLTATLATRPDPDAVMRLADEYAEKEYLSARFGGHFSNERDAARADLLAKVRGEA